MPASTILYYFNHTHTHTRTHAHTDTQIHAHTHTDTHTHTQTHTHAHTDTQTHTHHTHSHMHAHSARMHTQTEHSPTCTHAPLAPRTHRHTHLSSPPHTHRTHTRHTTLSLTHTHRTHTHSLRSRSAHTLFSHTHTPTHACTHALPRTDATTPRSHTHPPTKALLRAMSVWLTCAGLSVSGYFSLSLSVYICICLICSSFCFSQQVLHKLSYVNHIVCLFFVFVCISGQVMTRPKLRPCPSCQALNQASRKSCHVCFGCLSTKQKLQDKVVSLDSQWGQSIKRSRNAGRIIDSAHIAVSKNDRCYLKCNVFHTVSIIDS